ncbi:MAG: energy transducer TonB [Flavisolibacter sp.]
MTSTEILKADVLDILFEHRNKEYGAYALRKDYPHRLFLSLLSSLGLFALIFLCIRPGKGRAILSREQTVVVISDVPLPNVQPKIPPPPPTRPAASMPAAQQKLTTIHIVDNQQLIEPLAPLADITNISNRTIAGPDITTIAAPVASAEKSGGVEESKPTSTEAGVQREPEFPGGVSAWSNFLYKHLQVPEELEAGVKKTVVVRFQVSVDGSVTGFEVLQSPAKVYDEEVIRVLKKMPKWKPALQNGQPVARYFTQPVTFVGVEN